MVELVRSSDPGIISVILEGLLGGSYMVGHSLGGLFALRAAVARPDRVVALILEDPARPDGSRTSDPRFVAETEQFLDSMSDLAGQVRRMARDTTWSRAEIQAWANFKPLVDRTYVHRGLYLGDRAWEQRFNALKVPTLLLVPPASPMAPWTDALHNDLVRVVVVPGAGHGRRGQPDLYHHAIDAFLVEVT